MGELIDVDPNAVDVDEDGVRLVVFEEVTRIVDTTPPIVEDHRDWELPDPPLRVLIQEIEKRINGSGGVHETGDPRRDGAQDRGEMASAETA